MKNHRPSFKYILTKSFPRSDYMPLIEKNYQTLQPDVSFAKTSSNPMDRRMDFAAYFLACIQVLDKAGIPYEEIKSTVIAIAKHYVSPRNKFEAWMKMLPAKLVSLRPVQQYVKRLGKKVATKGHPDGFRVKVLTAKEETRDFGYGIDILECGICKLFAKHNAQEHASLLCEVDYITSSLAGLKLYRSGTIANGAKKCDFRFEKV